MIAAVDVTPELEPEFAALPPLVRYSSFVADVVASYRARADLRELNAHVYGLLLGEATLLRREHPEAWEAGRRILAKLAIV